MYIKPFRAIANASIPFEVNLVVKFMLNNFTENSREIRKICHAKLITYFKLWMAGLIL